MNQAHEIENEIERTRSELTDTLQAIERKLSPNRLMDEAMQTMRNVNFSGSRVMDLARDNPIPLALVGLGLGWLVLSTARGSSVRGGEISGEEFGEGGYQGVASGAGDYQSAGPGGVGEPRQWAGYGAGGGGDGGGDGSQRMSERAEGARNRVRELGEQAQAQASQVGQRMGRLTSSMRQSANEWAHRGTDLFQDHPLTVGLLAVAAGFAFGAALPRGRREAEMIGEPSGEFLHTARESGRAAIGRAGRVAQRAAETAVEGMQRTKEAVKEEARRQGLTGEGNSATAH